MNYLETKLAEFRETQAKFICDCGVYDDGQCPRVKRIESFITSMFTEIVGEIEQLAEQQGRFLFPSEAHDFISRNVFLSALSHYKENNLPTK